MDDKEKRELFCKVFISDAGERVLEELEEFAHYNDGQFVPDPAMAAYLQGRRSVFCKIKNIMEGKKVE